MDDFKKMIYGVIGTVLAAVLVFIITERLKSNADKEKEKVEGGTAILKDTTAQPSMLSEPTQTGILQQSSSVHAPLVMDGNREPTSSESVENEDSRFDQRRPSIQNALGEEDRKDNALEGPATGMTKEVHTKADSLAQQKKSTKHETDLKSKAEKAFDELESETKPPPPFQH